MKQSMLLSNMYHVLGAVLGAYATRAPGEGYPINFRFHRRMSRLREEKEFSQGRIVIGQDSNHNLLYQMSLLCPQFIFLKKRLTGNMAESCQKRTPTTS